MADALVEALNRLGYQPVFLPRTGYVPPDLYTYKKGRFGTRGRLVRHGRLSNYAKAVEAIGVEEGKAAGVSGRHTSSKSQQASIDFLGKALACIGVPAMPKLDLGFTGGTSLLFAFDDVTFRAVEPAKLDRVVQELDFGAIPSSRVEGGDLHIAYEYLYARRLLISRGDDLAFNFGATGSLGDYIDVGGADVKVALRSENILTFEAAGEYVPAFAYKAGRLISTNNKWEFWTEEVKLGVGRPEEHFVPFRNAPLELM